MKIRFKKQQFQTNAVNAVVECFKGQPRLSGNKYRVDTGVQKNNSQKTFSAFDHISGFKNAAFQIPEGQILENIQNIQRSQQLEVSPKLVPSPACGINLDIEMETGTGKTYCYIKTMLELNEQYGWSKFIIMVPSIAIREGVYKSLQMTAEHFLEDYRKKLKFFIYNSSNLNSLESFATDSGINVMVINVQAFNSTSKANRRIYRELDDFQSRKPIDVIKAVRPILILDEPQRMEGKKTSQSLKEFNPLMMLRYSATHKTNHNTIHRLDAVDAYNQKLVKKIAVRGISVSGLGGTASYLYLESIQVSTAKPPVARLEIEIKQKSGAIKRVLKKIGRNDNLVDLSNGLPQYEGYVVADIDATKDSIAFTNGKELFSGEAMGDVNEATLRRIQIREAIKAHFEKEQILFAKGIKVLTLFFIDSVAKYRQYDEGEQVAGEYAQMFEEEYEIQKEDQLTLFGDEYDEYLKNIDTSKTHNGYFSIDKKSKQLKDPKITARGEFAGESDDIDAYDLILKDKERLLSLKEPVRFIFSHSALREGWDNPNVFVICTLKQSDNTVSRRQEVGRGMRLCVNQDGDRMDAPATVHDINVLTVVANESYQEFVTNLQKDILAALSSRPRIADVEYFQDKVLISNDGTEVVVDKHIAKLIYKYLMKNDYTDDDDNITQIYHDAVEEGTLAPLPDDLNPHSESIFRLIDSVFDDTMLPTIDDDRKAKFNPLSENFEKKEFKELWNKINRKAIYAVDFDSPELVGKCVQTLNAELRITPLQYKLVIGGQADESSFDAVDEGQSFIIDRTETITVTDAAHSNIKYDLVGRMSAETHLTRKTIATILSEIEASTFKQFLQNPEDFIAKAAQLINEQKATVIIEHLAYDPVEETYASDIFTAENAKADFSKAVKVDNHIYDYVFTDSKVESTFVQELDKSTEVVVYAKLPKSFHIPTPVGNYNPDWAIAFKQGSVRHLFFIAETKGSMSSMELRKMEECKIECARKFFSKISEDQVKYDVVDTYGKMMEVLS